MRTFVVLCLVAVACADKLGYNYQPVGHSDDGLSFAPGGGSGGGIGVGPSGGGLGGIGGLGGGPSSGIGGLGGGPSGGIGGLGGGPSGGIGGLGGGPSGGGHDGGFGEGPSGAEPELEKEFYTFTANEDDFSDPAANEQVANSVKQGLRVIFIKGPENKALENAALSLAKHASDQQTAIYVLNKQVDVGDLANKLNAIRNNNNNHPDVHFVKYRTPEDAANAQRAIQSQYNELGGPSQSHDGGVAPVINFASPASPVHGGHHGGIGGPSGGSGGIGGPSSTYLPASILRSLRV